MPVSPALAARRALVSVLLALALTYALTLGVVKDSPDAEVSAAYKKVLRKAHPDKGGSTADAQRLQAAKEAWDKAKAASRPGRPRQQKSETPGSSSKPSGSLEPADLEGSRKKDFRIHATAVLLTYNGVVDLDQWRRFVALVESKTKAWKLKNWCATLEANKAGNLHIHLMLQFTRQVDCTRRTFAFEGLLPNAEPNDLLGNGFCRKKMQESVNRGMFYCWANKLGTQCDEAGALCMAGDYEPCWTDAVKSYAVRGRWPEDLWKAYKLSSEQWEEYLYLCRDGVVSRKRNLEEVRSNHAAKTRQKELEAQIKRIRGNKALFKEWPKVPAAEIWLQIFLTDQIRYPILLVQGHTSTGKTEWAKSLFKNALELKVGPLEHFPEKMRSFRRGEHDAVILDDVRNLQFVVNHQEKLQGKYDAAVEFGSTPGGMCAYFHNLFQVPFVVTCNYSTLHLDYLDKDDWLSCKTNRVLVQWPPSQAAAPQ